MCIRDRRTLLLQVQKAQDENTIAVTDGLKKTIESLKACLLYTSPSPRD